MEKWGGLVKFHHTSGRQELLASSPGHSQLLSRSHGENQVKVSIIATSRARNGLLPIFLHGCEIKSGSSLGSRVRDCLRPKF